MMYDVQNLIDGVKGDFNHIESRKCIEGDADNLRLRLVDVRGFSILRDDLGYYDIIFD